MAKIKQISFVLNETDNIVVNVKQIANEYQIPLNSALKVYVCNLIKENNLLKQEKPIVEKNNIATNAIATNNIHQTSKASQVSTVDNTNIEAKKETKPNLGEIKDENEDIPSLKAKAFAAIMGFGN